MPLPSKCWDYRHNAPMPSLYGANNRTQTFMQSRQALCQLRYIFVVLHFCFETLFR